MCCHWRIRTRAAPHFFCTSVAVCTWANMQSTCCFPAANCPCRPIVQCGPALANILHPESKVIITYFTKFILRLYVVDCLKSNVWFRMIEPLEYIIPRSVTRNQSYQVCIYLYCLIKSHWVRLFKLMQNVMIPLIGLKRDFSKDSEK